MKNNTTTPPPPPPPAPWGEYQPPLVNPPPSICDCAFQETPTVKVLSGEAMIGFTERESDFFFFYQEASTKHSSAEKTKERGGKQILRVFLRETKLKSVL